MMISEKDVIVIMIAWIEIEIKLTETLGQLEVVEQIGTIEVYMEVEANQMFPTP